MGWQQVRMILFFWMVWARYSLHQDGTLHHQWVIIRFHSRKLIKNSFEGFLNDIGKHIKTASLRDSYGDIINKTTIFFLPFWYFLCLSACHTSQQEPTSPADFQDLWIVKIGGHLFMKKKCSINHKTCLESNCYLRKKSLLLFKQLVNIKSSLPSSSSTTSRSKHDFEKWAIVSHGRVLSPLGC